MGTITRLALLTLALHAAHAQLYNAEGQTPLTAPTKRIAIVGAGTGGIHTLRTLLRVLPEEARRGWEVVAFEQRRDIGGIWLPDERSVQSPELPETPLYPHLRTNGAHPTMTTPHFPYKPFTNLYPHNSQVWEYHRDVVAHWNLSAHIRLNHEVVEARWAGTPEAGRWRVKVHDRAHNTSFVSEFDHLVTAVGHFHYPHEPEIEGREEWERGGVNRSVAHSIYFRHPEDFKGKNVLILGGGASGRDIAQQVVQYANSTYVSLKYKPEEHPQLPFPVIPGVVLKKRVSHFTPRGVVFADGSSVEHVDTVVLATGYEYTIPFLTASGHLDVVAGADQGDAHLTTNRRHIRPLYEHLLSLDAAYPLGALYIVGLPTYISSGFQDAALGLFIGYTIAYPHLLPAREKLLRHLLADEASQRAAGLDPAYVGHRLVRDGGATVYQDDLVAYLQVRGLAGRGGVPPLGERFTPAWRQFGMANGAVLKRAWTRVEGAGEGAVSRWLEGVETEDEWAGLIRRLIEWEKGVEEEEGIWDEGAYMGNLFG